MIGSNYVKWWTNIESQSQHHHKLVYWPWAVHTDCGEPHQSVYDTQKRGNNIGINTWSSTESVFAQQTILLQKLFGQVQGFFIKENIIDHNNQSTMKLEQNGNACSGKWTWHFNIIYFYVTDFIQQKGVSVKYSPMNQMIADYMTKKQISFLPCNLYESILGFIHLFYRSVLETIGNYNF